MPRLRNGGLPFSWLRKWGREAVASVARWHGWRSPQLPDGTGGGQQRKSVRLAA